MKLPSLAAALCRVPATRSRGNGIVAATYSCDCNFQCGSGYTGTSNGISEDSHTGACQNGFSNAISLCDEANRYGLISCQCGVKVG